MKISAISCKLKPTYVFVFVLSAILDASILEPKISTRYHVYDCEHSVLSFLQGTFLLNQAVSKGIIGAEIKSGSLVNISSIVGKVRYRFTYQQVSN